ncbi:MAG: wax ester/triacylglycerol synthase family O-acyltransferase [Acidobacteriota bacterium]|nr:wax ester/triacylglycerol synthase family O-acyltransferase [Acidobacteriota bacterium]MDE3265030.1 wax ester/triacylglycerol synthase family O-acyltransferase [Acidobacteriota bacterium]
MATELNRFLTPLDAAFLYVERPHETMHIGGCMVYEGEFSREYMVEQLAARMHLLPRYRQRVLFPPFLVSHPVWVDDPSFNLENHVEEVWIPEDSDHQVLARAAAEAYGGMLDRNRPLWKGILLRGIPGHTAVVWKIHHAMVDGVSGVDLSMVLSDFSPTEELPDAPAEPWAPKPLPDSLSLLQEAMQHRLGQLNESWTNAAFDAARPRQMADRVREMVAASAATLPVSAAPAPRTVFNRPVSKERGFAWAQFSFPELRAVKSALSGTVNDVVLTVLAGGIGRYLRERGQDPKGLELRAMCPVSMRQQDERGQLGNLVSNMIAPLFVGVDDPVERLGRERDAMNKLKEAGQAKAFYQMTQFSDRVPPLMAAVAATMPFSQTLFNTVSTNVPGPMIPLYFGPHKLVDWLPLGIVSNNIGLFVAILSYNQRITLGVTVDAKLIPDAWFLAQCLEESYAELREAAGVESEEPSGARCFAAASPQVDLPQAEEAAATDSHSDASLRGVA